MYQTIFKLAIPFMPYKKPIILDEISDLIKVLKEEQINDLLLISGKAIIEGSFFTEAYSRQRKSRQVFSSLTR